MTNIFDSKKIAVNELEIEKVDKYMYLGNEIKINIESNRASFKEELLRLVCFWEAAEIIQQRSTH